MPAVVALKPSLGFTSYKFVLWFYFTPRPFLLLKNKTKQKTKTLCVPAPSPEFKIMTQMFPDFRVQPSCAGLWDLLSLFQQGRDFSVGTVEARFGETLSGSLWEETFRISCLHLVGSKAAGVLMTREVSWGHCWVMA
jgi:hypothetical protein